MKSDVPCLTTAEGDAVVLQSLHAQGRMEGLLLSMTLRQVFCNDTDRDLEVTYCFPLAWGAVVLGMQATVGSRSMVGHVIAQCEARERYEHAIEHGDAAVMVERTRGGVFSASLGSLKPDEKAVIELSYAQLLSLEQGRIRLVVPTTIAPRHGNPMGQGDLTSEQSAEADLLARHRFSLALVFSGALARARISSPTHALIREQDGDAVTLRLNGHAWLDRDFVVQLEGVRARSFALAGPDSRSGEGHMAVIASYRAALPPADASPLRLKLLVDCSGSMAGDSIAQARAALRRLARLLGPRDQVAFSRFGNQPQRVLGATAATTQGVGELVAAIDGTEACLGGTEMAAALQDTFGLPMALDGANDEADILLITDGAVWDAQRIVDEARRGGHRIHALGVGSAPSESLLRDMAHATGGACELITPNENMAQAVRRLLDRIRHTRPVAACLRTNGVALWASRLPPRLAGGETVHLFLRLPARPTHAPALVLEGQEVPAPCLSMRDDDLVARLVAAHQVGAMADKAQAQALAQRYQLVTEDTTLLLVMACAAADQGGGAPALHRVRPMLAAGWAGTSRALPPSRALCSRESGPAPYEAEPPARALRRRRAGEACARWSPDAQVTAERLIAAFNDASRSGRNFRQALRAATELPAGEHLLRLIALASQQVRGPLKGWACYLLWLHEAGPRAQRLNDEAHALVLAQLRQVDQDVRSSVWRLFEAGHCPALCGGDTLMLAPDGAACPTGGQHKADCKKAIGRHRAGAAR